MEIPKTLCQLKCRIKNIDNTKYAEEKLQKLQSKIIIGLNNLFCFLNLGNSFF